MMLIIFPKLSPSNVLIGVQSEFRLDSRFKHAGMTEYRTIVTCGSGCAELTPGISGCGSLGFFDSHFGPAIGPRV